MMEPENSKTTCFEGMTSISAVIKAIQNGMSDRKLISVYIDSERKSKRYDDIKWLTYRSAELGFHIEFVSGEEISKLSSGTTHGGIIAECTERTYPEIENSEIPDNGFYTLMDGIEDPYNLGFSIRSLYACGCDGIILPELYLMNAASVVAKASAGTSELIPIYTSDSENGVRLFKNHGYKTVCAGIRNSVSSFEADLKKPILLVIGGEKRGISASVSKLADTTVRIEYARDFRGSLPSSSAVSILSYEIMRQNNHNIDNF